MIIIVLKQNFFKKKFSTLSYFGEKIFEPKYIRKLSQGKKMNRFNGNSNENFGGEDEDFDLEDFNEGGPEGPDIIFPADGLAQQELKSVLIQQSIEIASSSWLWRFKSMDKKLQAITEVYFTLMEITDFWDLEE